MATIIQFVIPTVVASVIPANIDRNKLVNAVQAELNAGTRSKVSVKQTNEYKMVKAEDGSKWLGIVTKTKTGETLLCKDTLPARFNAWCNSIVQAQTFGEFTVVIPKVYLDWFNDKFVATSAPESNPIAQP